MYKTFKEIKCGEFFYNGNNDLCVKVQTVVADEELFWADESFNAINLCENGNYYREWFKENSNEKFKTVADDTEVLNLVVGW